jgi:hypothetical protein
LVLASCLTVMTAGAVSGCSVFERNVSDGGLPAYTAQTEAPTLPAKAVSTDDGQDPGQAVEATAAGDAEELVAAISLTSKDVKKRGMTLDADAEDLAEPTLTGCDGDYPSEAHRVARRRVALAGADGGEGDERLLSDVVAYDSEESAENALQEWRETWGDCPFGARTEVLGLSDLRYDSYEGTSVGDLPAGDNLVAKVALTGTGDETAFTYTIAQRSGAVLAIVALESRAKASKAQTADVRALAKALGNHLVAAT